MAPGLFISYVGVMSEEDDDEIIDLISRAPARYSFMVDVGKMAPKDVEAFLKKVKKQWKDKKINNPMNGDGDTFETN